MDNFKKNHLIKDQGSMVNTTIVKSNLQDLRLISKLGKKKGGLRFRRNVAHPELIFNQIAGGKNGGQKFSYLDEQVFESNFKWSPSDADLLSS